MPLTKLVYYGGIYIENELMFTTVGGKQSEVIKELNSWLFDYQYNILDGDIEELPPLDDWTRGKEDHNYWNIYFPTRHELVWITNHFIDF
jgi:hypothetical protein